MKRKVKRKRTIRQKVYEKVKEFLENKTEGAELKDIIEYLRKELKKSKDELYKVFWNTIRKRINEGKEKEISIDGRGKYILSKYLQGGESSKISEESGRNKEEDFYPKFAEYLEQIGECTNAIPLGHKKVQDKWSNPDVFGVYKYPEDYGIKPITEIVSAEIKTDTSQLVNAFGQACSYKAFSHKVYLVIPQQAAEPDIIRLETLCLRLGIGLVLFDKNNIENPNFQIRTRPVKTDPNYHYVNEYIKKLDKKDRERLFGK